MSAIAPVEIEDARSMVLAAVAALPAQPVALECALGRVLAEQIVAREPVPAFDSSAMDGFAVRAESVSRAASAHPVLLSVVGESRAGAPAAHALGDGEAIAISTGAQIPHGADAVVRLEDTRVLNGSVEVARSVAAGHDIRRAGDDLQAGQAILGRGRTLGPAEVGVLASLGHSSVRCASRPRLALLASGDELLAPGEPMRAGAVRDSNSFTIAALAAQAGAEVVREQRVGDQPSATREALGRALEAADVVVACGGVSVGAHDHVRGALRELGAHETFWGVALKPGRPTWFGTCRERLVFALPGNPVSAMVTFLLLVRPALRALQAASDEEMRISARFACDYEKPAGRAHAVRCRLRATREGWVADPTGPQGSHILSSMLDADALALLPSRCERVRAGERVEAVLLRVPAGGAA